MVKLGETVDGIFIILSHCLIFSKYLVIPEFKAYICIYSFTAKPFHFKTPVTGQTYLGTLA